MGKPFDVSRFRKAITKSIDGLSIGFHDPSTWVSTGNHCLNYLISGDFQQGVALGKVTVFAGEPASGKSLIVSGNVVKNAQEQGIFVVLVDTENALDEPWLQAFGVDTSEDKLLKLSMSMVNDVAKLLSDFIKAYQEMPEGERPKVLFVVDSLGMLMTPTAVEQFEKGDMKGDMGILAKQLKALVKNVLNKIGSLDIGLVATNHTYASQDPYNPDSIVSGGAGFIFAASAVIAMKPMKLKEDEDGTKVKEVLGIRSGCKIMKTRYNQPFQTMEIRIPWIGGMDKFSGLFDLFLDKGTIVKDGNKYIYVDNKGESHSYWRKEYNRNENGILDLVMSEFNTEPQVVSPVQLVPEESEPKSKKAKK